MNIRRIATLFAMAVAAAAALLCQGCVSSEPTAKYFGRYSSADTGWFVQLYRDGSFTYSFWIDEETGKPQMVSTGFCDFDVDDSDRPRIIAHLNYMQDKFQFVFSPDGRQMAVMLKLPDNNPTVEKYGRQILLTREAGIPAR
ncbi:MAG: hypothetical protein PHI85_01950 [Victivallaceae bacterium]|nr:hypothetical protein [Victivallaceae bacterium]